MLGGTAVELAQRLRHKSSYYNSCVDLPQFQPMTLARTRDPFDHADFVFELKYDGFRALAYVADGRCRLVSRRNHVYKACAPLCAWIDELRRRGDPVFVAFIA